MDTSQGEQAEAARLCESSVVEKEQSALLRAFEPTDAENAPPVKPTNTNIYIRGLAKSISKTRLHELFSEFGTILSAHVMFDFTSGASLGVGFVNYEHPQYAAEAIRHMNNAKIEGYRLTVRLADDSTMHPDTSPPHNILYLAPVPDYCTAGHLTPKLAEYGEVISVKVRHFENRPENAGSVAFVEYNTVEEATRALEAINSGAPVYHDVRAMAKYAHRKASPGGGSRSRSQSGVSTPCPPLSPAVSPPAYDPSPSHRLIPVQNYLGCPANYVVCMDITTGCLCAVPLMPQPYIGHADGGAGRRRQPHTQHRQ